MRGHPATRLLLLAALALSNAHALQLYGCSLADDLCEPQEECFPDGLFGQCHSELTGVAAPSILPDLEPLQLELLRLEITRLQNSGVEWQDQQAQCVLAYFKLSASYDLQYDPNFCDVQTPANIWALIQLVEMGLNEPQPEPEEEAIIVEEVPSEVLSELAAEAEAAEEAAEEEAQAEAADADVDADAVDVSDGELAAIISQLNQPPPALVLQEHPSDDSDPVVDSYVEQLVSDGDPDIALLSDDQLDELIGRIIVLKNQTADGEQDDGGEEEEAVPVPDVGSDDQAAVKKDVEKATPVDTGLQGKEHNIVKGRRAAVSRVVGNRVYLKVDIKNEEQLYPLVEFLQNTIALPNNLLFDDFQFHNGQLSLRISRLPQFDEKPQNEKRIDTVEGVAQAVYKRRKDIQRLSGAAVEETGIGIGDDSVPVERSDRDWIVMPVMFVCAFTIAALVSVMAIHVIKRRRSHYGANITRLGEAVDGKSCQAYEDLCRQRMSEEGVAAAARTSKTSSTSSWSEDEAKKSNIDISTGHVILNFLQEYINDGDRITEQWEQIRGYKASKPTVTAAAKETRAGAVLPYDETLVPVNSWDDAAEPPFLNASFLHDDDPRQAAYVVCTTPDDDDVTAFWQAVWQHGVCLVVNLSSAEEVLQSRIYWPATGSITHGPFEIHLVSEHIWSDDYVVRSFYLKHLRGGQTRTITQFHYLSWPSNAVPSSPKSLLDFRRKVAKSYRGEGSPLLVHSARGAGRAGVYCAVDSLCNRLHRGVKEIDVAASVEHLRDQRAELVQTADQYKTIYACVAAEVSALVRALQ